LVIIVKGVPSPGFEKMTAAPAVHQPVCGHVCGRLFLSAEDLVKSYYSMQSKAMHKPLRVPGHATVSGWWAGPEEEEATSMGSCGGR
jgi:hypothetical protein